MPEISRQGREAYSALLYDFRATARLIIVRVWGIVYCTLYLYTGHIGTGGNVPCETSFLRVFIY